MRIEPKNNNLVIEPFELGEVTRGGILLPRNAKASTPYRYGTVVAVGPGRYASDGTLIPIRQEVGDVVAFAKNQGVEFPMEDDKGEEHTYLLINDQFLLGTMRDMPVQSQIAGLDGRLIMMNPSSRAVSDGALQTIDDHARIKAEGFIDSSGTYLDDMAAADRAEAEAE